MTTTQPSPAAEARTILSKKWTGFVGRFLKYALGRAAGLGLMLVIGMFVAVVVFNFGGYMDQMKRATIDEALMYLAFDPEYAHLSRQELLQVSHDLRAELEEELGLNEPFLLRCVRWTYEVLTLDLGGEAGGRLRDPNDAFWDVLRSRLPYTLLLFGVSNLLVFFASFFMALFLFHRFESFLDKLFIFLSPISSIPNWVLGVFLVILFAGILRILPFPRELQLGLSEYISQSPLYFLKYMILPVLAIFLNMFFQSVYSWRTFFLLQAGEDYIELAKAKGLSERVIQRRYLVRTSLPYIITSFAMTMLGIWQASFVLEKFFFWPGLGSLFFDAIRIFPVTIGIIVLFAYLLAITVFVLDLICALVDPRIRLGVGQTVRDGAISGASTRSLWKRFRLALRRPRVRFPQPVRRLRPLEGAAAAPLDRKAMRAYRFSAWKGILREIRRYPSAITGLVIIGLLVLVSIYTVIAYPYRETILRWRGDEGVWENNPEFAPPAWTNLFRPEKLPETIVLDSREGDGVKQVEDAGGGMRQVTILFPFEYSSRGYPQDLVINVSSPYLENSPFILLTWITPDGREIPLDRFSGSSESRYSFAYDYYYGRENMLARISGPLPWETLFGAPGVEGTGAIPGTYQVRLDGFVFEDDSDIDAEVVLYGQVYGLAGTDDEGRDLTLALLWGTPFSLAFGLLGAFGTGILAMGIAATAVWFGGWVDGLIQRITEINMLLPAFPIAIMIYFLYTHSIWVILGVIILLSVFGNALKNYRAAFLQVKESGYVQAAQVYGAGNFRLILKYMVPRIVPLLVPQLVALVPSYIFLEPTLAFLGIADPHLPTWGKVLMTSLYVDQNQVFYLNLMHNPYLAVEPLALMFITGLAFSLLGMALDRIFNPRLRSL